MPEYAPANVNGVPNGIITSVPSPVITVQAERFVPRLRAGYFYVEDRRHVLFAEKGSGYLEDITWYDWATAQQVIDGTERVWVRGIEVTGTDHYRFRNGHLQINGAALTHPGVLVEEINYDVTYLDPIDLGGVLDPDAQIKIDYSFNDWVDADAASASVVDGVTAGVLINLAFQGSAGNDFVITINATGGAGSGATLTETGPGTYDLDWFNSTTVQEVITAIDGNADFDAVTDGFGTPGTDLFSTLLTGAAIVPPSGITFAGGSNAGFDVQTSSETFLLGQADPLYELPKHPANNLPVVMTDDRMQRWDRRDISPQFTVSEDNIIEFNTPRNYVSNPDFEGDLELWMTAGTPTVETEDAAYALPHSYSASKYIELPTSADMIGQFVPAFDEDEQLLMVVARGANTEFLDIDIEFFDLNWASLGTESTSVQMTGDWNKFTFAGGPAGRLRTYDFAPPDDAEYAQITLAPAAGDVDIQIDYVFWGAAKLAPDAWHPHPRITVEYDVSESENYVHNTLITHHVSGEPLANAIPLEICDTHGVSVSSENGFLYIYEYDNTPDFQLGLGGINAPLGDFDQPITTWPVANNPVIWTEPIPGGGFYLGGTFTSVGGHTTAGVAKILADGTVDTSFAITSIDSGVGGQVLCLKYDADDDILYIGGSFSGINGTTRNALAAVDGTDATLLSFDPDVTDGTPPAAVRSIAIDKLDVSGTMIYFVGDFDDVNSGTTRNNAAKVNTSGVVQAWDPNANDVCYSIILGDDRMLYIGGAFTSIVATSINRLARLDADQSAATLDTTFDPDVTGTIYQMMIQDSILYFVGLVSAVGGTSRNRAAAVSIVDGSLTSWDPDADAAVNALWVTDRFVFLAGLFSTIGGVTRNGTAQVGLDGSLSSWDPDLDNDGYAIAENEGVVALGGDFTTVSGVSYTDVAFFKYYDNKPVAGRRWLPYAKVDGLGKLCHVAYLGYYAKPWTREVTEVAQAPAGTTLELLPVHGLSRAAISSVLTGTAPAPAKTAGDTTFDLGSTAYGKVQARDFIYLKDKLDETRNAFQIKEVSNTGIATLARPLPYDLAIGTTVYAEYKVLKAFVGQQRVVRLKLTDENGAPVGQHRLTVKNRDPSVVSVDWDLPTNQDGEAAFLLTFLDSGAAQIEFSGSNSVTLNVVVGALPSAASILDDPQGPLSCAAGYSTSISDWS